MDKILLVLPPMNSWATDLAEPDLGYAHGLISFLVQISDLTVFAPSEVDAGKYDDYLKKDIGSHVRFTSLSEMNRLRLQALDSRLIEGKPFIDLSSQIYEHICRSDYDCVIFDVFEATGFIPIRAKRTGLGLEKTLLVSWLRTCHEFRQNQVLETSQYPGNFITELELDFGERYCCQYCDLILTHTDSIFEWTVRQEWNLDLGKVLPLDDLRVRRSLKPINKKLAQDDSSQVEQPSQLRKTNPLISICVAHFNDGRNLRYLLKSVKENDYENFEVIIVDDGSTDFESLEIFDSLTAEYSCDSWRFIKKENNESIGPTRNFAVNQASGELIIFMDSDNLASKTMISDFARGMLRSGADCLSCGMIQFKGDGGEPGRGSFIGHWLPLGACLELVFMTNVLGDANFCVKKSVFTALGGFWGIRGHVADDWEFLSRLILVGFNLDVVPKALYFYRVREGSWLHTAWSSNSVQELRERILSNSGPQHARIIHDLLLRTIGENDQMRASAWKLDRKIVKIALKMIEVLSEERRISIENIANLTYGRLKEFYLKIGHLIKSYSFFRRTDLTTCPNTMNLTKNKIDNSRFFVRCLLDSQRVEKLERLELPLNRPVFGAVGGLDHEKDILGFLRLAYWMQMSKDDSFFVLLGNGAFEDDIRTTATKYNLKNFKWIPSLEKPEDLYEIMAGLVIASRIDKDPSHFFEALACGVPVFSTDAQEAGRILKHYGSGIVVSHDPQHKDFADCFSLWKSNLEIYKIAAMETAVLVQKNFGL